MKKLFGQIILPAGRVYRETHLIASCVWCVSDAKRKLMEKANRDWKIQLSLDAFQTSRQF
jgi:hypothetical protein